MQMERNTETGDLFEKILARKEVQIAGHIAFFVGGWLLVLIFFDERLGYGAATGLAYLSGMLAFFSAIVGSSAKSPRPSEIYAAYILMIGSFLVGNGYMAISLLERMGR